MVQDIECGEAPYFLDIEVQGGRFGTTRDVYVVLTQVLFLSLCSFSALLSFFFSFFLLLLFVVIHQNNSHFFK